VQTTVLARGRPLPLFWPVRLPTPPEFWRVFSLRASRLVARRIQWRHDLHARPLYMNDPTARFTAARRGGSPHILIACGRKKRATGPEGSVSTRSVPADERGGAVYACVAVWTDVFSLGLVEHAALPNHPRVWVTRIGARPAQHERTV
jgi:hypothetical protein